MSLHIRAIIGCIVAAGVFAGWRSDVRADVVGFNHTWTGAEPQGPDRLFRDAVPSVAGVPKAFPGTVPDNPTFFTTLPLSVLPGSVVSVNVTQPGSSFLAIYESPFNHLSLATNYLGDQGSTLPLVFSVTAPASGMIHIVGMTVNGTSALGQTFMAEVTFVAPVAAVPEASACLSGAAATIVSGLACAFKRRRAIRSPAA
jgi:hypothetical protein